MIDLVLIFDTTPAIVTFAALSSVLTLDIRRRVEPAGVSLSSAAADLRSAPRRSVLLCPSLGCDCPSFSLFNTIEAFFVLMVVVAIVLPIRFGVNTSVLATVGGQYIFVFLVINSSPLCDALFVARVVSPFYCGSALPVCRSVEPLSFRDALPVLLTVSSSRLPSLFAVRCAIFTKSLLVIDLVSSVVVAHVLFIGLTPSALAIILLLLVNSTILAGATSTPALPAIFCRLIFSKTIDGFFFATFGAILERCAHMAVLPLDVNPWCGRVGKVVTENNPFGAVISHSYPAPLYHETHLKSVTGY